MVHDTFDINIKGSGFNIATMLITGFMFGVSISNAIYKANSISTIELKDLRLIQLN